jgi:hypothetical protein
MTLAAIIGVAPTVKMRRARVAIWLMESDTESSSASTRVATRHSSSR